MGTVEGVNQGFYENIEEAAAHIVDVLSGILRVNTIFVATNDGVTNVILEAFNRKEELIVKGTALPFMESYCSLVLRENNSVVTIADTLEHTVTSSMDVTNGLGNRFFVGVPIMRRTGEAFGTICIMDDPGYKISETDMKTLQAMAVFLGYVVDLESALHVQEQRLSDSEQLQEKLQAEKERAESEAMTKTQMLKLMSHEIRNPLNGILGLTDLMRTPDMSEEQAEYVNMIETSGNILLSLLNNMMNFNINEAGKTVIHDDPFDLVSTIENTVYLYAGTAASKKIELGLNLNLNVSQVFIGDEIKIGQMLGHVMQYAMDSTREGAVLVTAEMRGEEVEDTSLLLLRVRYTGQMLSDNRLRISTAKPETMSTEKLIGSNLGLAVSQNLAILMHGRIQVNSLRGDETEFQISLPLRRYWDLPQITSVQQRLKAKKVLLAKDPDILQGVSSLMRNWEMDVHMTSGSATAYEWIKEGYKPDVAVVDLGLREGITVDFVIELKQQMEALPVIVLVPYGMHMDIQQAEVFDAVLTKPVRQTELLNALSIILP
ncbi:histidine kinase dimerization/phospho-acceptor domain-containing protein [Paenibacillus sp. RRE4]|uniref:hybrid sensor histidine kinase/response regulator n=1 Tax=Paenibacillus sp. RRE4 TaxID=2962587 RepID=UPI002881EA96|nr:histidine kinase dimerization/phospho-acceptor domain-containing protein [Paenibacillus sp. RRE4]MDT0124569.1 histidine kinase dimerization/phospho-acceptor domain-containing protein [Paenibacillus sp. RRE4]